VNKSNHILIGIAGGSGSGKTTFLRAILDRFDKTQIALVSQDNYYLPKSAQVIDENGVTNFDLPTSIDRAHFYRDMVDLVEGKSIEILEYNFNNPDWIPQPIFIHPAPIIIMEGLFVFHYEEIRNNLDMMVYVDAHHESRLERRIRRDAKERGYPEHEVRYQWANHVRPSELQYLEPYKSDCQLVVDNNHSFDDGLNQLIDFINKKLG
jgi:uridine kinase